MRSVQNILCVGDASMTIKQKRKKTAKYNSPIVTRTTFTAPNPFMDEVFTAYEKLFRDGAPIIG